ncbi:MAG: class I SAM-dependent methyltransferase [Chloroflexota bacterium]|nr:MAG: class I SAM-dependent methyltransferase [Chloroflexota bacterium]
MRYVRCNYCGADEPEPVNHGPDLYLGREGDFHLVRCRICSLIYQNPQPTETELNAFYPTDAYELYARALNEESTIARFDLSRGLARRCTQVMKRKQTPGHVLDIGCATGNFLRAMKDYGWSVTGVELNHEAASYARQVHSIEVLTGTVVGTQLPDNAYDVITMWDVFEHVLDPRATLEKISKVIKPGGLLVIGTPNPKSLEAKLFGRFWAGWDRPRHTYIYYPDVLRRYLEDYGYGGTQIVSFSGRLRVTLLSMQYLCIDRMIEREKCLRFTRLAYNWPLRLITWPIYRLGEALNQTTNMCAFSFYHG